MALSQFAELKIFMCPCWSKLFAVLFLTLWCEALNFWTFLYSLSLMLGNWPILFWTHLFLDIGSRKPLIPVAILALLSTFPKATSHRHLVCLPGYVRWQIYKTFACIPLLSVFPASNIHTTGPMLQMLGFSYGSTLLQDTHLCSLGLH